ncbi:Aldehyde dehydrogenase C-terminal [Penicillium vulpinum]|uniref:NACHT domain-containing protein n=1 Tax=Penicillium vulpinum TaxID=29845 RepID=A0A1V6RWF4_9EURO|nr:Aldehyde dehydrogenase C-terminal [Penicillium vulpinum]KAJ5963671.1 Aldehyde dehydrogenase C-terminal [Penicillium vulpinum]OQE05976.1 hypothetical protein PENVUL_c020G02627 [Penicillium vulpinum]
MGLKTLVSKLKRRIPVEDPISHSGPVSGSNGRKTPTFSAPKDEINLVPYTPATDERDLWLEAFEKLPRKLQQELEKQGMNQQGSEPMIHQVKLFQEEAERERDRSLAKDWKVQIGDHDLPVRQMTIQIVHWAERIGDVAFQFAPSPGAGFWAVAKSILQGIDTFDKEKSALLSVIDKAAGAIFCGQVYYEIYSPERTGRKDVVDKLHDAIAALYGCVLELLATSSDLSSNTAVQFCQAIFDPTKPSGMLVELERLEQELAAAAGKCEDTAHAHQEVTLRSYLQEAQNSLNRITHHMEHVFQWVNDKERRDLLEWVSDIHYGRHHDEIEERREPDTGDWVVQDGRFREWMDSPSSSTLWLQGSPGTGKTFLTSAVVKHIMDTKGSPMEGVGYFFCKKDEKDRRESLPVLRSLVRQLAAPKNSTKSVRKSLRDAREKATDRASRLGSSECHRQLVESFKLYSTSVIILDAFDEILDDELDILIEALDDAIAETKDKGRVKLFVASRPEKNIGAKYGSNSTIIIQAQDNKKDIEKFVIHEMEKFGKKHPNSDVNSMKDTIIRVILDKCENMFLWAALQVKQMVKCNTVESIHYALENLPKGLDEMYNQIHLKIHTRFPPERAIAERTLKWVLCSPYPLTTEELLSAARMSIEKDSIKMGGCIQQESLLAICENLLIVDIDDRWRFFHLSAREYLEKSHETPHHKARSYCAQVCLLSLMKTFGPATLSSGSENPFNKANPFSEHNQTCWAFYVRGQIEEDQSVILLKKFLGSPSKSSAFYIGWFDHLSKHRYLPIEFSSRQGAILNYGDLAPATTPMFTIAQFSLYETLHRWCDSNDFDPFQENIFGQDLLTIAAITNSVPFCTTLVAKGVSVNRCGVNSVYGSALSAAARWNSLDTVKYLVQEGKAVVNLPRENDKDRDALKSATIVGNLDIVKYFVEEVNPDMRFLTDANAYGNLLSAAACLGTLDVMRYLVEEVKLDIDLQLGVDILGRTLADATGYGKLDIVKYLVEEAKVDVDKPFQDSNALCIAIRERNMDMVRYLVKEAKANVDIVHRDEDISAILDLYSKEDAIVLRDLLHFPSDQEATIGS